MTAPVWTIGHSSRSFGSFVEALQAHKITRLLDIRAYPRSARHPQFSRDALSAELPRQGVGYAWRGRDLGGFRGKPGEKSPHLGLSEGFAAYAEYMADARFLVAVAELAGLAAPTVLMCAERDWRSCQAIALATDRQFLHRVRVALQPRVGRCLLLVSLRQGCPLFSLY